MPRQAVILAGGKASRLGPYTTVLPKPLLPVGDRAILDLVIDRLRDAGFGQITLAVDHLARLIRIVFGDGAAHGVHIAYSEAVTPLGTAGALGAIEGLEAPFLAMNGDVLTDLDYDALYRVHLEADNALTIASHRRVVPIDYGILRTAGEDGLTTPILGYEEKPEIDYTVSMGVYVVSPQALRQIEPGERLDMPELVQRLLHDGERVGSFQHDGLWLDIGRSDDYERAIHEYGPPMPGLATAGQAGGATLVAQAMG